MAYHFEQLAQLFKQQALSSVKADEVVVEPPQREASDGRKPLWKHRYKLADGYDGKLAMLIKAAFEEGMFLKEDNTRATSVEDVAHYIGDALDNDYHDWRQTLRGAVLPKCYLDFFERLKDKMKEYKKSIKHENDE